MSLTRNMFNLSARVATPTATRAFSTTRPFALKESSDSKFFFLATLAHLPTSPLPPNIYVRS